MSFRTCYAKCPESPLKICPFKKNNLFIITQKFSDLCCCGLGQRGAVIFDAQSWDGAASHTGFQQISFVDFLPAVSPTTRFSGNADTVLSSPGASSRSLSGIGYKGLVSCLLQYHSDFYWTRAKILFFPSSLICKGTGYPERASIVVSFFKMIINTNTIIGA